MGRTALALLLAAPLSYAQVGAPAPELDVAQWFNARPVTLQELRGKVVLVVAVRAWSEACRAIASTIVARAEHDEPRGLFVLVITAEEEPEDVERWIAVNKAAVPVALMKSRELERAIGLDGFPHVAVIDAIGTVTWSGDFGSEQSALDAALAGAQRGRLVPRKLEKLAGLTRQGEYAKAWAEVQRLAGGKLDELERAELERWKLALERRADAELQRARARAAEGRILEAVRRLEPIARAKPAFPVSADADKTLAELAQLPNYKTELKIGEQYLAAWALAQTGEYLNAIEDLVELAEKYPKLAIGQAARKRAALYVEQGFAGFDFTCPECQKLGKACSKHKVDVKL